MVIGFGMRGVLDTTPELAVTSGYTWGTGSRHHNSGKRSASSLRAPPHLHLMAFGEMSAWRDWIEVYI